MTNFDETELTEETEVRCPGTHQRLFYKVLTREDAEIIYNPVQDICIELACSDCRREMRKQDSSVVVVFHYYGMFGDFESTTVIRAGLSSHDQKPLDWSCLPPTF